MHFALVGRDLAGYCAHYFVSNLKSWPLGFHRKFSNETHLFPFLTEEITIYALCGNTSYQNICFFKKKICKSSNLNYMLYFSKQHLMSVLNQFPFQAQKSYKTTYVSLQILKVAQSKKVYFTLALNKTWQITVLNFSTFG